MRLVLELGDLIGASSEDVFQGPLKLKCMEDFWLDDVVRFKVCILHESQTSHKLRPSNRLFVQVRN